MKRKATTQQARIGRIVCGMMVFFAIGSGLSTDSLAQKTSASSFTDLGFSISGGPVQSFGDLGTTQGDFVLGMHVNRIDNYTYMGYGVEASYKWDDNMDLISVMGRMEFGLKKGKFTGRDIVGFNTMFLAFMAGYSTGTIWDRVFVASYDDFDDAEVSVSGVPVYASLGWRRIGRMGLSLEAIAGATFILSQETYELGGSAPSVIPGFGVRLGFGFDTFFYSR